MVRHQLDVGQIPVRYVRHVDNQLAELHRIEWLDMIILALTG
jgi:hypothetical protein